MTWEELIFQINQIPEERRGEKAVFYTLEEDHAWEIDAMVIREDNDLTSDDLEGHSIFDEQAKPDLAPMYISP